MTSRKPPSDYIGTRFERLTVTGVAPSDGKGQGARVSCQCDCGKTTVVRLKDLNSGNTVSCGCYRKERLAYGLTRDRGNLIGRRFGRLVVVAEADQRAGVRHWLCQCDCGNRKVIRGENMRKGYTKSCGCIWRVTRSKRKACTPDHAAAP